MATDNLEWCGRQFCAPRHEFGEGPFDWVDVRTVRRKVPQRRARGLDGASDAGAYMSWQIVHDDDVAKGQRGHEDLLDLAGC